MGVEERFYMSYARSRPNELVPWIEQWDVPLLTNAMHRWSTNTDRFLHMWEYDTPHVIDAGGYNVQRKWVVDRIENPPPQLTADHAREAIENDPDGWKEELESDFPFYPFTLEEYHEWLSEWAHEFEWASAMDYACEEKFDPLWSVSERVEATMRNTRQHFDLEPDHDVLPVLQGRSVDSYVRCWEELGDDDLPRDYVGLGTVCRISSESRIVEVERAVRDRTDVAAMHGFGVKIDAYKLGSLFETSDSQAWSYEPTNGKKSVLEWDGTGYRRNSVPERDDSLLRTVQSFKTYYAYVTWLKHGEMAVPSSEVIGDRAVSELGTTA